MNFKNNDIIVALKNGYTPCDLLIVHKGAICKVKCDEPEYEKISIWKSKQREFDNDYILVKRNIFRLANKYEKEAFDMEIRNIDELKKEKV
jgi:hypothetical protein